MKDEDSGLVLADYNWTLTSFDSDDEIDTYPDVSLLRELMDAYIAYEGQPSRTIRFDYLHIIFYGDDATEYAYYPSVLKETV